MDWMSLGGRYSVNHCSFSWQTEKSSWNSKYCKNSKSGVLRSELAMWLWGNRFIFLGLNVFIWKMKESDKKAFKFFLAHPMMLLASVCQASSHICFIQEPHPWESVLGGNCTFYWDSYAAPFPPRILLQVVHAEEICKVFPDWSSLHWSHFPTLEYWFLEDKDLFLRFSYFFSTEPCGMLDLTHFKKSLLRLPGCHILGT